MNCTEIRLWIREKIQHENSMDNDASLIRHIHHCELCRSLYKDAILSRELRQMPIPEPFDDFAARAIRTAVKRNRMKQASTFVGLFAAALLIFAIGTVLTRGMLDFTMHPDPLSEAEITGTFTEERTVRVMIDAVTTRQNATLAIDLAEHIELKNYPGCRHLTWQTGLTQGKNLLELPLVIRNDADGYVTIRYRYNGNQQEVQVQVRASAENRPLKTTTS
jgi:hypothetical protein